LELVWAFGVNDSSKVIAICLDRLDGLKEFGVDFNNVTNQIKGAATFVFPIGIQSILN